MSTSAPRSDCRHGQSLGAQESAGAKIGGAKRGTVAASTALLARFQSHRAVPGQDQSMSSGSQSASSGRARSSGHIGHCRGNRGKRSRMVPALRISDTVTLNPRWPAPHSRVPRHRRRSPHCRRLFHKKEAPGSSGRGLHRRAQFQHPDLIRENVHLDLLACTERGSLGGKDCQSIGLK